MVLSVVTLTEEQVEVLREALGDACAYRQGEAYSVADMDEADVEPYKKYQALADALGLTLD